MPQPSPVIGGFVTDLFVPVYRPLTSGEWELRVAETLFSTGYWSGPVLIHGSAVLVRSGQTWMSITPMEVESQEIGIRRGRGHVLIFGLGLGWAAAASASVAAVDRVTVVEKDPDVLALHRELDIFAQLSESERAKVRVVEADALEYVPDAPVHLMVPDIWLPLVNDERLDQVRQMQANVGAGAIYFWGQEMEIARHAVAAGRTLDDAGIAATIDDFRLPLVGADCPGYADKLVAAARRWMRGRWLPGSTPPW